MKRSELKTGVLGLAIAITASLSSLLTACSTASQNQSTPQNSTSSPVATDAGNKQMNHGSHGMQHSGMDHSMMDLGPADAEYDLRFIDAMIPHHRGAIDMSKEAEQKSKRSEIKQLARNIVVAQNREENELMRWRKAWYPNASETPMAYNSKMGHSMPMSAEQKSAMMMKMELGTADAEFDLRFLSAMIPHHEGAVIMAKDAVGKAKHPELKQLAQDIIQSQQAEIDQMKQWRQAWYNQ